MRQKKYNPIHFLTTAVVDKDEVMSAFSPLIIIFPNLFNLLKNHFPILPGRRVGLMVCFLFTAFLSAYPQTTTYSTKNNYTGNWETPSSWSPIWNAPLTASFSFNITINGYISCIGPLIFSGASDTLCVNDTLVVYGDLTLGNNSTLKINKNGILIVWGNLNAGNQTKIEANGYGIVTGNYNNSGAGTQGSFISYNSPTEIFVGGAIQAGLDTNLFPVFNCPGSSPYHSSHCSYGNMTDLLNDPIHSFFQSTCHLTAANAGTDQTGAAMCGLTATTLSGNTPTVGSGLWSIQSGTGGTISAATNPSSTFSGTAGTTYVLRWTISNAACTDSYDEVTIAFPPAPTTANAGPDQTGPAMCGLTSTTLTGNTPTVGSGLWSMQNGTGGAIAAANSPTSTFSGSPGTTYVLRWTISNPPCADSYDEVTIAFLPAPTSANAGADQELNDAFTTKMGAVLSSSETGEWSLLSGSGSFDDVHSPVATVSDLSAGKNTFLWTVMLGSCSTTDTMVITVNNLFVPQVITPNGDGKNDFFVIKDIEKNSPVELIVFDRWGNEVYHSTNYINDWSGRSNNGDELSNDTYFYVLKFADGRITKGFVVIKK
jgi:gliding motility-associated-like protein